MAKGEKIICVYVSEELRDMIDSVLYNMSASRSGYIRDILLDHLSKGDKKLRTKLIGKSNVKL